MSIGTAVSVSDDRKAHVRTESKKSNIDVLNFFPQALFLLNGELEVIYSNQLAKKALDSHLVSLRDNKLHFNSSCSDEKVAVVAQRLSMADTQSHPSGICSERIILSNIDGRYRSYTLSRESLDTTNFILSIQNDLVISDNRLRALGSAFSLSQAELKILKMMVTGLKPKQIAYEVGISLNTVRSHLRTLYAKMQVNGYDEVLSYAIRLLA